MKSMHFALAAFALAASSTGYANEAYPSESTAFRAPTSSNVSRADVQAEARRASSSKQLRTDDAYPQFMVPAGSNVSRMTVQKDAITASANRSYANAAFDSNFIGGM